MARINITQHLLMAVVVFTFFLAPVNEVCADCTFVALPSSGFSIVCSSTITEVVTGTAQDDVIRFLPQASLIYQETDTGNSSSQASLTGIAGLGGDDSVFNDGDIEHLLAQAETTAVGASLTISASISDITGSAVSETSTTADTAAIAIAGGLGNDLLDNQATLATDAVATVDSTNVAVNISLGSAGMVTGTSLSDASVEATAETVGIDGEDDNDTILNSGDIELGSTTAANAVSVLLDIYGSLEGKVGGEALSDSSTSAISITTGIDGGQGMDTISNNGEILATSVSEATAVGTSVDLGISTEGIATGTALNDASVLASATVTGIDGGGDVDAIDNYGTITLLSSAEAQGVAVVFDIAGSMQGDSLANAVSDASVTAISLATGISGGEGDDLISNDNLLISAQVDADSTAVSVGLTVSGSLEGAAEGSVLSDGSSTSSAIATGIDGGTGQDTIENWSDIYQDAHASATTVSVGADVAIAVEEGGNATGAGLSDASVLASTAATGIDGGDSADVIDNRGDIELLSNTDASGVAVALSVAGTVKGDAAGTSVSDASVTATSLATGIDGGEGDDRIDQEGLISLTQGADATAVSVDLTVSGSMEGNVDGAALSDSSATASTMAVGIDGGLGSDEITNRGAIFGHVDSSAIAVGVGFDVSLLIAKEGDVEGNVSGSSLSDASVFAGADTIGILGNSGTDNILNRGELSLTTFSDATGVAASVVVAGSVAAKGGVEGEIAGQSLSNSSVAAYTGTTGLVGGTEDDQIINLGDLSLLQATSSSTGVSAALNITAGVAANGDAKVNVTGKAVSDAGVTAEAQALGLDGGLGSDYLDNSGEMNLLSSSEATGVAASLSVSGALTYKGNSTSDISGSAVSISSVFAKAEAAGIDGGMGQDTILNTGNLSLMDGDIFDADALGVSASLNVSGNVAIKGVASGGVDGTAASNATVTAEAKATGIDGGGDSDSIANSGTITILPEAKAAGISASLNVSGNMVEESEGTSMSDASVTALSTATGIDGGEGNDNISNEGIISLMKQTDGEEQFDAEALGIAASLDISGNLNGTAEGKALSQATTTAEAVATGISGADGIDQISNLAAISADVDSRAEGVAVAGEISFTVNGTAEGSSLSDVSTNANANAVGIDAGEKDDTINNSGPIQLSADAGATSTAVSVTIAGSLRGQVSGDALSKATTAADAKTTGIDAGSGDDEIINLGSIAASTNATTDAVAVSVGITVAETGIAEGAAMSDSNSTSLARSIGIDGGGDNDGINNQGAINAFSLADAQATAVSVGLTGAMKGLAEGKSVADSSAEAISQSIGLYGNDGNDELLSMTNKITAHSVSIAEAQSVAIQLGGSIGVAQNSAVADSSATSLAYSAALDGGQGNDIITNGSEIEATTRTAATASSTSVTATLAVGSAETIGTGDSSATASAEIAGIEGGTGDDEITNSAAIRVGGLDALGPMATAQADSTTVNVGLAVGLNTSEAASNASALAEVNAAGISGGSGDDSIDNTGEINVGPDTSGTGLFSLANAESTTVDVSVSVGASLGQSVSDSSAISTVNIAGIRSGSGDDQINNTGAITVGVDPADELKTDAMSKARAGSETVSVGLTLGGSFKDASSKTSATAFSTATGIETGLGADHVNNTGTINSFSSSEALGSAEAIKASITIGALGGAVSSDASSLSSAFATGVDSAAGADSINTNSDFTVKALSKSTTESNAEDLNILSLGSAVQAATANSSATAEALARGVDGGSGADMIIAAGQFAVAAETLVDSTARSSTITGLSAGSNVQEAQSQAGSISDALAIGIDGGVGNDDIHNSADLIINSLSTATTEAVSASNTGFNIAGSSSGEAVAGATASVTASSIGIRGGLEVDESDADIILNEGLITVESDVSAITESTSNADGITIFGEAEGTAISDASATILADGIGIDAGADGDTVVSMGEINVISTANATVSSTSNVDSYATFGGASSMGVSDASAKVLAAATGISGGTGNDIISSWALVDVEARSVGSVIAASNVNATVTFGGASSEAASNASVTKRGSATGIDGGAGADEITNYDNLYVHAISEGSVTSNSHASASTFIGNASSMTAAAGSLEGTVDTSGIIGGSGEDIITNFGHIDSIANANLFVQTSSVATAKSSFIGDAEAHASSVSTLEGKASSLGASGDAGDDRIENTGVINVSAIADTMVESATVAIAESTWGSSYTEAASSNFAAADSNAIGISSGAGNDRILNSKQITVESGSTAKVNSLTVSSSGPASSDTRTLALGYASGIDAGDGNDEIINSGTIEVTSNNTIETVIVTIGSNVKANSNIEATVNAIGISGDDKAEPSAVTEDRVAGATSFVDSAQVGTSIEDVVGQLIRFKTGDSADYFTIIEEFDPETGTFFLHDPLPEGGLSMNDSYVLGGGYNSVLNSGDIIIDADAKIDASGWTLDFRNPEIESQGQAQVDAIGIQGGEYDDYVENTGYIDTQSTTEVLSTQRTLIFFGGADQELIFSARSESAGITTGAGDDSIINRDSSSSELEGLDVAATATSEVSGVTTSFFGSGETYNFVDSRTFSTATGFDHGDGQDKGYNDGQINVSAESITTATAISDFNSFGETNARANAVAVAHASGIRAEDGGDRIQNSGGIIVNASAMADSYAQGSDVIGGGANDFTSAVTEDSATGSLTFVDASLIDSGTEDIVGQYVRFLTGENLDFAAKVESFDSTTGTITLVDVLPGELKAEVVDDEGNITSPADEYTLANGRDGESGAFANAYATGIDLNNGLDHGDTLVTVEGTLEVTAYAEADSTADAYYNGNEDAGASVTAEAQGVVTGAGNDLISNSGVIRVGAEAFTSASGDSMTENRELSATGIASGDGDDIIVNSGSIITGETEGSTEMVGTAINSGVGNDTVILDDISVTSGDIDFGEGNDTLHVIGSPVMTGLLSPGAGMNSLIFEGAGSFQPSLAGFNDLARKQGEGVYRVSSLPSMQTLAIEEGTLWTDSDYQFATSGLLQTQVNADGSHGKLYVEGVTSIAGDLLVSRDGAGPFIDGREYNIIEGTNGVVGSFSEITLPDATLLLTFSLEQKPNLVGVVAEVESYTSVASNPVEMTLARQMDRWTYTATGELQQALGEFQSLAPEEYHEAFLGFSPGQYGSMTQATLTATEQFSQTLLQRIHSVRLLGETTSQGGQVYFSSGDEPILLALNGPVESIAQLYRPIENPATRYGMWLKSYGQWNRQDDDGGFVGYDHNVYGAAVGFDSLLSDNSLFGFSLGYSGTDIDLSQNQGDGDIDTMTAALYGSFFSQKGYLDGVLAYGQLDYQNQRNIRVGTIQQIAQAEHDGHVFSAFVEGGYNVNFNPWILQPFANLAYVYLNEDRFVEEGAGTLSQVIESRSTDSLVVEAGLRASSLVELESGMFIPEISMAWRYNLDIDDRKIESSFVGQPNTAFTIEGNDIENSSAVLGVGITMLGLHGFNPSLKYNGQFSDGYDAHSVVGELRWEF